MKTGRLRLWIGCAILGVAAVLWVRGAMYPLLARHAPVEADTLVVEGWVADELLVRAAGWAESNGVGRIVATGGPIELGSFLAEWKTYAEMTKARMEALGLAERFVLEAVPAGKVRQGRTRESARALRAAWGPERRAFNLASEGPHTRRSWRVFRQVMGGEVEVGSVALEPREYGENDWWTCSEGVRAVLGEAIAYGYDVLAGGGGGGDGGE